MATSGPAAEMPTSEDVRRAMIGWPRCPICGRWAEVAITARLWRLDSGKQPVWTCRPDDGDHIVRYEPELQEWEHRIRDWNTWVWAGIEGKPPSLDAAAHMPERIALELCQ